MSSSKDPFEPDQPLDQLLHRSPRSDVDADRLDRIDEHWESISRRRVRVQAGVTMMVGLMITVGSFLAFRGDPIDTPIAKPDVSPELPTEQEIVRPSLPGPGDENLQFASDGAYEQLICVSVERRIRERKQTAAEELDSDIEPQPERDEETMDELVALAAERLADEQSYDDLVSRIQHEGAELELLAWIESAKDATSIDAALHLLSHVASSRSIPILMRLRATHHEIATRLLAQVAEPQLLFRLAQEEPEKAVSQELAASLLQHANPQAVYLFLQLVDHRPTSVMALDAVSRVEAMPTELLLQCLSARSRKVRLTAAMVLGRSKDPAVSAQLVQLLQGSATRRAAMVALVASDDDLARRFVDQASRDVYLAASVHAALTVVNSFRLES